MDDLVPQFIVVVNDYVVIVVAYHSCGKTRTVEEERNINIIFGCDVIDSEVHKDLMLEIVILDSKVLEMCLDRILIEL